MDRRTLRRAARADDVAEGRLRRHGRGDGCRRASEFLRRRDVDSCLLDHRHVFHVARAGSLRHARRVRRRDEADGGHLQRRVVRLRGADVFRGRDDLREAWRAQSVLDSRRPLRGAIRAHRLAGTPVARPCPARSRGASPTGGRRVSPTRPAADLSQDGVARESICLHRDPFLPRRDAGPGGGTRVERVAERVVLVRVVSCTRRLLRAALAMGWMALPLPLDARGLRRAHRRLRRAAAGQILRRPAHGASGLRPRHGPALLLLTLLLNGRGRDQERARRHP